MPVKPFHKLMLLGMLGMLPSVLANTLSDPTRPTPLTITPAAGGLQTGWVLNSTLVAPDRRVAVINGRHVTEGESIGNAKVLEIRKQTVLIQARGKRITLHLLPDIMRKQP